MHDCIVWQRGGRAEEREDQDLGNGYGCDHDISPQSPRRSEWSRVDLTVVLVSQGASAQFPQKLPTSTSETSVHFHQTTRRTSWKKALLETIILHCNLVIVNQERDTIHSSSEDSKRRQRQADPEAYRVAVTV